MSERRDIYVPSRKLDYKQVCHCCGGEYQFVILDEWMWCTNKRCSAYNIRFTIPRVMVKYHRVRGTTVKTSGDPSLTKPEETCRPVTV